MRETHKKKQFFQVLQAKIFLKNWRFNETIFSMAFAEILLMTVNFY